ncbi:MAG TPA: hypothetical protein VFY80_03165 [Burkholderiales bacterium]|nr:hypothetical protein [Burkholderiales bacterium]
MKTEDFFAYQDLLARAVNDIHARCGNAIDVLWDRGRLTPVHGTHQVRIWNGLGAIDAEIPHSDLAAGGVAYQRFLEHIETAVKDRLTVGVGKA